MIPPPLDRRHQLMEKHPERVVDLVHVRGDLPEEGLVHESADRRRVDGVVREEAVRVHGIPEHGRDREDLRLGVRDAGEQLFLEVLVDVLRLGQRARVHELQEQRVPPRQPMQGFRFVPSEREVPNVQELRARLEVKPRQGHLVDGPPDPHVSAVVERRDTAPPPPPPSPPAPPPRAPRRPVNNVWMGRSAFWTSSYTRTAGAPAKPPAIIDTTSSMSAVGFASR